ncbi:MAG: ACT domain-containing protein [Christensenellaceae bacterium]
MSLALAEAGINIRMLIQGCREINIIAGVDGEKYETAIKALYNTFLRKSL